MAFIPAGFLKSKDVHCIDLNYRIIFIVTFLSLLPMACDTGYSRKNGDWVWLTHDEHHGKRAHWIEDIDQQSFKVLKNKNFAADKNHVYYKGKKIKQASPIGFTCLTDTEYGYAVDRHHAFFNTEVIVSADPASFEIIQFPYSRDKNDVYCGTVPLRLTASEATDFKVTNEDKLMAGTISASPLVHFLEYNPGFSWISQLNPEIEQVIIGEWGTGESGNKKFKGIYQVLK